MAAATTFRQTGCTPKVMFRLIEADHYVNKKILVVGGRRKCGRSGHRICASPRQTGSPLLPQRAVQSDQGPQPETNRRLFGVGQDRGPLQYQPGGVQGRICDPRRPGSETRTAQRLLLGLRRWSASLRLPQGDPHSLSVCVTRHRKPAARPSAQSRKNKRWPRPSTSGSESREFGTGRDCTPSAYTPTCLRECRELCEGGIQVGNERWRSRFVDCERRQRQLKEVTDLNCLRQLFCLSSKGLISPLLSTLIAPSGA